MTKGGTNTKERQEIFTIFFKKGQIEFSMSNTLREIVTIRDNSTSNI